MIEHARQRLDPSPYENALDPAVDSSTETAPTHSASDTIALPPVDRPRAYPPDSRLPANDVAGTANALPPTISSKQSCATTAQDRRARSAAKIAAFEQRREARIARELRQLADMKRRHHDWVVADRKRDRKMRIAEENRARYRFADVLVQRMAATTESEWGLLINEALDALSQRDNAVLAAIIEQLRVRQVADS